MPQMKGIQGWVNGWVNVNNNHVKFPRNGEVDHRRRGEGASESHSTKQDKYFRDGGESLSQKFPGQSLNQIGDEEDTDSIRVAGNNKLLKLSLDQSSLQKRNQRSQIYRTTTQRPRNTNRLVRTNSHSDLLKEKAASKWDNLGNSNVEYNQFETENLGLNREVRVGIGNDQTFRQILPQPSTTSMPQNQHQKVALPSKSSTLNAHPLTGNRTGNISSTTLQPFNTGQYVNENAFANVHRTKQLAAQLSSDVTSKKTPFPKLHNRSGVSEDIVRDDQTLSGSIIPNAKQETRQNSESEGRTCLNPRYSSVECPEGHFNVTRASYFNCEELRKQIVLLEADNDYLRSVALNSEYVCMSCEKRVNHNKAINSASSVASGRASVKSSKSKHSVTSNKMNLSLHSGTSGRRKNGSGWRNNNEPSTFLNENMALAESSQRLIDVTARHKRQIENMSKETARWRNDMHLKLSKLAMRYTDLNDESAKRKEQVDAAKSNLDNIRDDRDAMSSKLSILEARITLYEKQELEYVQIRRLLEQSDNETLTMADQAIQKRDEIIDDLTTRLQHALTALEDEKGFKNSMTRS